MNAFAETPNQIYLNKYKYVINVDKVIMSIVFGQDKLKIYFNAQNVL